MGVVELTANDLINDLKAYTDKIRGLFGGSSFLETLVYAEAEYGIMQRAELCEIIYTLEKFKQKVDMLHEECMDIPSEKQGNPII